jgi:Zinc finger, C3HC4 type (RING finger)
MVTRHTARLERLAARNAELDKRLENSLRETRKAQKCQICTSAEADRLTECGHLFCKECIDKWEEEWYRESDPDGDKQGTLKGILTCPTCREWVVMSKAKHIDSSSKTP